MSTTFLSSDVTSAKSNILEFRDIPYSAGSRVACSRRKVRRLRIFHPDSRVRYLGLAERFLAHPGFKDRKFWRFIEKLEAADRGTIGDLEYLTVQEIFGDAPVSFVLQRQFFAVLEDSVGAVLVRDSIAPWKVRSHA